MLDILDRLNYRLVLVFGGVRFLFLIVYGQQALFLRCVLLSFLAKILIVKLLQSDGRTKLIQLKILLVFIIIDAQFFAPRILQAQKFLWLLCNSFICQIGQSVRNVNKTG